MGKNVICLLGYNYPELNLGLTQRIVFVSADKPKYEIAANQVKEIDTLGLCNKQVWDSTVKHSLLIVFIVDKSKLGNDKLDNIIERQYFSYAQVMKNNGVITLK